MIKLGNVIRDRVSGFSGIAAQFMITLHGNYRWAIQPRQKEGETNLPESLWFDDIQLEVIEEGLASAVVAPKPFKFERGTKVVDTVSGFEGIATNINVYMNGCVFYSVEAKAGTYKDRGMDTEWINQERLDAVPVPAPKPAPEPAPRRPGGPPSRVARSATMG